MIVEVVAVGTELLLGQIVNRNAADIAVRLADAAFDHYHQTVVGDNVDRAAAVVAQAAARSDAVIITGGIGPTQDDVTREALCAAAGVPMAFSDEYAGRLRDWWARRGREMPETNLRQAEHPDGAELLPNPKGTAPGLRLRLGQCWVFALPGVPEEMRLMLDQQVLPFLVEQQGGRRAVLVSRVVRTWGESESRVAALLGDLYDESENPTVAFLASAGEIKVRLTARAADREGAAALIAPLEAEVRRRLGPRVFGADDETVEAVLLGLLRRRGWSLGTAESATGGMVAARITSVPGASDVFVGSVVAYSTGVKEELLGVDASGGVVSEDAALSMAEGAASRLGADVAIAVTGSAGPNPQEREVGTMIAAVRTPDGARARTLRLPGDRERVRTYATTSALHLARLAVSGEWWGDG